MTAIFSCFLPLRLNLQRLTWLRMSTTAAWLTCRSQEVELRWSGKVFFFKWTHTHLYPLRFSVLEWARERRRRCNMLSVLWTHKHTQQELHWWLNLQRLHWISYTSLSIFIGPVKQRKHHHKTAVRMSVRDRSLRSGANKVCLKCTVLWALERLLSNRTYSAYTVTTSKTVTNSMNVKSLTHTL